MPYQVSWQSVSMKSQRPVHVLGAALAGDTPQQAPAAARIVAATMPSFVMAAPLPQLGPSCIGKCQLQDTFQPWRKDFDPVASAPQFLTRADYDSIRPRFFAPLTVRRPLTMTIVLASDAVAEWFGCGHITQRSDPQICR